MRGVLMFAHNNGLADYGTMAYCSALTASHHIDAPIALVTDEDTWNQLRREHPRAERLFVEPIFVDPETGGDRNDAPYLNMGRLHAYELSPFDETLMVDSDVLFFDNTLDKVWGSNEPMRMNHQISLMHDEGMAFGDRMGDRTANTYWATLCYFRQCKEVETFFAVARRVAAEYQYYGVVYEYPTNIVRLDYIFSVANHVMSGYLGDGYEFAQPLPASSTLFGWQWDEMIDIELDAATFIVKVGGQSFPVKVRRTVHCMHKDSLLAHADKIIKLYG